jgi:hypothetical protein
MPSLHPLETVAAASTLDVGEFAVRLPEPLLLVVDLPEPGAVEVRDTLRAMLEGAKSALACSPEELWKALRTQ